MICPCSVSRFRILRKFCALFCLIFGCCTIPPARPQDLDKPLQTIDEEITAFAIAPDGRIVYSVRRPFKTKHYDLEHDDIWLQDPSGKRRRLLQGEKFARGDKPFTYEIKSFRWSPNGHIFLAELFTTTIMDESGKTQDATATLVMDENGKEVKLGVHDSLINPGANAMWLADNVTIVYDTAAVPGPQPLRSFHFISIASGPAGECFEGRTFRDAEPLPRTNVAIAVERDKAQAGPFRLQHLDLLAQEDTELATLDNYAGSLSISPAGTKAAYFVDNEALEVRDLTDPAKYIRLRVGVGVIHWSPDESQIFVKRAPEKKSGDIVSITLPPVTTPVAGQPVTVQEPPLNPVLHSLAFRDFAISSDGKFLAVVPPGKHSLQLFPFPR
jgi:dipeptidyl aminopeptidase/acylaminoacyl peptidase